MDLQKILQFAIENGASDVHIQAAAPPMMRITGQMRSAKAEPLTNDQTLEFIASIAPESAQSDLDAAIVRGLDFSYAIDGLCRFRCSA